MAAPNGLLANLFGPVEGRRHDSAILAMSGLLPQLEQHSVSPAGENYAYMVTQHIPIGCNCPYERRAPLIEQQEAVNQTMSQARVSVKWIFRDIVNYFKVTDFKNNSILGLSSVGKIY